MFRIENVKGDPRRNWFELPSRFPRLCKPLAHVKKGKDAKDLKNAPRAARSEGEEQFRIYEDIVRTFFAETWVAAQDFNAQNKVQQLRMARVINLEEAHEDVKVEGKDVTNPKAIRRDELELTLLFFLNHVLDEETMNLVSDHCGSKTGCLPNKPIPAAHVGLGQAIRWKDVVALILSTYDSDSSVASVLAATMTCKRQDLTTLRQWLTTIKRLRATANATDGVTLGDHFWNERLRGQMTPEEVRSAGRTLAAVDAAFEEAGAYHGLEPHEYPTFRRRMLRGGFHSGAHVVLATAQDVLDAKRSTAGGQGGQRGNKGGKGQPASRKDAGNAKGNRTDQRTPSSGNPSPVKQEPTGKKKNGKCKDCGLKGHWKGDPECAWVKDGRREPFVPRKGKRGEQFNGETKTATPPAAPAPANPRPSGGAADRDEPPTGGLGEAPPCVQPTMFAAESAAVAGRVLRARARVKLRDARGGLSEKEVVVVLDTGSNMTLGTADAAEPTGATVPLSPVRCLTGDTPASRRRLATITIQGQDGWHALGAMLHDASALSSGCQALLSQDAIRRMNVDMNAHIDALPETLPLQFRSRSAPAAEPTPASAAASPAAHHAEVQPETNFMECQAADRGECFLGERKIAEFLARGGDPGRVTRYTLESVDVNPKLHPEVRAAIYRVLTECRDALAPDDGVPRAMNTSYRYKIPMRPGYDASKARCPQPRYTPAQKRFLMAWAERELREGGYELWTGGQFASRIHLALKPGKSGKHASDFSIRVCGDYVQVNDCIQKMVPVVPRMEDLVHVSGRFKFYIQADLIHGYRAIIVAKESRHVLAVWTPMGLLNPIRLPFGEKNAGTVLQINVTRALMDLPPEVATAFFNYADDVIGGQNSEEEIPTHLRAFLRVCLKHHLTLKPTKLRIGYSDAEFLGYQLQDGTVGVAQKNTQPVADCPPPTDKSQVRRFIGLCLMSRHHVPRFAVMAKPLQELTGSIPWSWQSKQQAAFDQLKAAVVRACRLATPDYKAAPFTLATDASDDGMGAVLYQVIDGTTRVIKYLSKTWPTRALHDSPVYYREAYALIWALRECRYYLLHSPFTTKVLTDHAPLQWIKHARRGPVNGWLLEHTSTLDFTVSYLKGSLNVGGDASSRYPLLGPGRPTPEGDLRMWQELTTVLADDTELRSTAHLWVYAGDATRDVARMVRLWRTRKRPPLLTASVRSQSKHAWDAALVQPRAEISPAVCARLLRNGRPFACLVPSDLVQWTPLASDDEAERRVLSDALAKTRKLTFLTAGMTWVIHRPGPHVVCLQGSAAEEPSDSSDDDGSDSSAEDDTETDPSAHDSDSSEEAFPPPDRDPPPAAVEDLVSRQDIIAAQRAARAQCETDCKDAGLDVHECADGLLLGVAQGRPSLIILPAALREQVVQAAHTRLKHARLAKVRAEIARLFHFPSMRALILRVLLACTVCGTLKARLRQAHGLYRAVLYSGPRLAYGVDFYAVGKSLEGFKTIMTIIDLYSRWVMFLPLRRRTAKAFVDAFLRHVVWVRGCPTTLVSDGAPELVGKLASALARTLGIRRVATRHYPQGNAVAERVHVLLGEGLRLLPKSRRPHWPAELGPIAFAHNVTIKATTGLSPFEIEHGAPGRTPESAALVDDPPPQGNPMPAASRTDGVFSRLTANTALYKKIATRNSAARRMEANARLNRAGGEPIVYAVGDHVAAYVPTFPRPQDNWRSKHVLQWRGPCVVVSRNSLTSYTVRCLSTNRRYDRTVSCLSPWRAPVHPDQPPSPVDSASDDDDDDPVGDIWAVIDTERAASFDLVRVLSVQDDCYHVHCLSAAQRDLARARFLPAHIETSSGMLIRGSTRGARATPWTWDIPIDAPELILAKNLKLLSTGRLASASLRRIRGLRLPHTYHH